MGLALAGLHFVAGGQLDRLLLCLLGFVVARTAVKWLTRPRAERPAPASKEVHHAP